MERDFKVIDSDTRLDQCVAERLRLGDINWRELQSVSVQISRYKFDEKQALPISDGVYQWMSGYDDFLGYMKDIVRTLIV